MFSLSTLGLAYTSLCAVAAPGCSVDCNTFSAPNRRAEMIELYDSPAQRSDFDSYMRDISVTTRKRWLANLPPSVKSGERRKNVVQFRILRDGTVPKRLRYCG